MMSMSRKITILFAVLCIATLVVSAGDKKMSAADHAVKLKAELGLSGEQATQAEAIIAGNMAKMNDAHAAIKALKEEVHALRGHENADANAEAIEAKIAEIKAAKAENATARKAHHASLRAILTEEQAAQFDEMMAAHQMEGKKKAKH